MSGRATNNIAIEWKQSPDAAVIAVEHGNLKSGRVSRGEGSFQQGSLSSSGGASVRLELGIDGTNDWHGANPTLVRIRGIKNPVTFLLRDVSREYPIFLPAYGVAVTDADDNRSYGEIEKAIIGRGGVTNLQKIESEPEESFAEAAKHTLDIHCPIWMGVSRDVRIFEMGIRYPQHVTDYVQPRFHGNDYYRYPGTDTDYYTEHRYGFVGGRGWQCTDKPRQRLDDGMLPILHITRDDDDIHYETTGFVTLERNVLTNSAVGGTHFIVADGLCHEHVFTEEHKELYNQLRKKELDRDEETVMCCRIVATNKASVPRYAFFKAVHPLIGFGTWNQPVFDLDPTTGFQRHKDATNVFAVSKLNGGPMPQKELAFLLRPGETCTYDFLLPHRAISDERAAALARRDVAKLLEECRAFWHGKLEAAGRIEVPERRVNDMVQAGFLQMDMTAYGNEPSGPLLMSSGIYSANAAETWENVHFYDSLGCHKEARRTLQFFLEKQHESGFIQNFTGYMLETGCVLLGMGEHYRYTRDEEWAKEIAPGVIKACQFIIKGQERNRREELRGKGYGMVEGQVADPKDAERIFMLNAYAYAGLNSAATLLTSVDPKWSLKAREHADMFKADLAAAFNESLADGPVVPLGDGTWVRTAGPWAGTSGPVSLFLDGKVWMSHGSMTLRDDILGPIHMFSQGIIDPHSQTGTDFLNYTNELMMSRNVAGSQPYYMQHPVLHLRRGEVKAFLKAYYNGFSTQADREIYTWWEHFFHVSPHKVHETVGFLMQTRNMLWMEENDSLRLLRGIPRAWLESGKRIELRNVKSFFGRFTLKVNSNADHGIIEAQISVDPARRPRQLGIRLPHPLGKTPREVKGGIYDRARETVVVTDFSGDASIQLRFDE